MEQMPSGEVPIVNLPGSGSLLVRSWAAYKRLMTPLLTLSVGLGVTLLVYLGLISLLNFSVVHASHTAQALIEILNTLIQFASCFAYALFFAAMLCVIKHRDEKILTAKEALKKAMPLYRSLLWVGVLSGLAIYGAAITLILPLLMSVWFYFAVYILVAEEKKGFEALAKSHYLTRGVWLAVGGRYLVLVAIMAAITFLLLFVLGIPVVGGVLFILLTAAFGVLAIPFFATYDYLRYEDLVALPRSESFHFFKGERALTIFFAIIGLILVVTLWISSLLSYEARTNASMIMKGGAALVLFPVAQNAGPNLNGIFKVLNKLVYVYTPDAGPVVPATSTQYDPSLYPTTELDGVTPTGTLDSVNVNPSTTPALNPNTYTIPNTR